MDFGPGAENRPKRQQAQRNSRTSGMDGLLAAPFRQFFATSPGACPYIQGRAERKLIVELGGISGAAFYDDLSRAGFRRSHRFAYRPACRGCASCVPVRIAVERFRHTRSTRHERNDWPVVRHDYVVVGRGIFLWRNDLVCAVNCVSDECLLLFVGPRH